MIACNSFRRLMRSLLFCLLVLGVSHTLRAQSADTGFAPHLKAGARDQAAGREDHDRWRTDRLWLDQRGAYNRFRHRAALTEHPTESATEAYVTYDDNYLYIAMIGHDRSEQPSVLRRSARDQIWTTTSWVSSSIPMATRRKHSSST